MISTKIPSQGRLFARGVWFLVALLQPFGVLAADEGQRGLILGGAGTVFGLTLAAILFVLVKRGRANRRVPDAGPVRAFLNDPNGQSGQATHELGRKPTMLGRVADSDTRQLQYVVIAKSTIGRRHALIEYKDYAFWIADQGSINGTYVNEEPVTSEMRLQHGDRIRLHQYELQFFLSDAEAAAMRMPSATSAPDANDREAADPGDATHADNNLAPRAMPASGKLLAIAVTID